VLPGVMMPNPAVTAIEEKAKMIEAKEQRAKEQAALSLFRWITKSFFVCHLLFALGSPAYDPGAYRHPIPLSFNYIAIGLAVLIVISMAIHKYMQRTSSALLFVGLVGYAALASWVGVQMPYLSTTILYLTFAGLAVCKAAVSYYLDFRK
jgi:hypothetical protein